LGHDGASVSSDAHAWLDIADTDIDAARRSLLPDPEPNIPAAAYHCQQAVEKLIKTLLIHLGLPYLRGRFRRIWIVDRVTKGGRPRRDRHQAPPTSTGS